MPGVNLALAIELWTVLEVPVVRNPLQWLLLQLDDWFAEKAREGRFMMLPVIPCKYHACTFLVLVVIESMNKSLNHVPFFTLPCRSQFAGRLA